VCILPSGCAEGQSPFAEGLGVSPSSPFFLPQEWGLGGLKASFETPSMGCPDHLLTVPECVE